MDILVRRIARKATYTIGRMYIDGEYFCDTLEDTDRGLSQKLPVSINKSKKRKGKTAIPTGKYRVTLEIQSQKFSKVGKYSFCDGYLPRLINVKAFEGILIHIGNTERDTEGCILVGQNKKVGMVLNSTDTFMRLYEKLQSAEDAIYITIQ